MKKYLILAALLLAVLGLKAQQGEIIYVDFDPDWIAQSCFDTLWIDFDQDGTKDLLFYEELNGAATLRTLLTAYSWEVHPMRDDDTIPPYPAISEIDELWVWHPYVIRPGNYAQDGAVFKWAIRHRVGEHYYYGWFQVLPLPVSFDRYAFCTIPDYPLMWGETDITGIEENGESSAFAIVHPNPTKTFVFVKGEDLRQAEVINTLGQQLLSVQGKGNELCINLAALPAGVYFVTITNEEGRRCVRKVVKK
ncbi:MAG: T9SS type A sorting domain-containing protein [Bacteroidales bacterium]|nr:T9SS type A sorting domain-containing protein [Bacteroidales bacterium]